jgi:hypothetical protein
MHTTLSYARRCYTTLPLALASLVMAAGATATLSAQSTGQPPAGTGPPTWARSPGKSEPAPEWMAWRSFYSGMARQESRSPSSAQEIIKSRARLADNQIASVLMLGKKYLADLENNDRAARADVEARFALPADLQRILPSTANLPVPPGRTREEVAAVIGPGKTLSATPSEIRKALMADGTMARVEQARGRLLAEHKQAIKASIGYEGMQSLERWISADVAPRVRVYSGDITPSSVPGSVGNEPGSRP